MHGTGPRKEGKGKKVGAERDFFTLRAMGNLEGEAKLSIFGSALTSRRRRSSFDPLAMF